MDKEAITDRVFRLVRKVKNSGVPDTIAVLDLLERVVELATTEEREACIECADRWAELKIDDSTVLSVREFITGERQS